MLFRSVTASFGVASWRIDEGVDGLLLRADSAVYVAKQAGRDRVETVAKELAPAGPRSGPD